MAERHAGASAPASEIASIVSLGPRELLDANPDVVFACGPDGNLLWLNRAFDALTGLSAADFIGRPALSLVAPSTRARALRVFVRQRRRRTPVVGTGLALLDASGGEVPIEVRMRLVDQADGDALQLGMARPAAARLPLPAAPCTPAAANLLTTLSHASRTHMDGVMSMAGLLLQSELSPEQRTMVGVICDAGRSLLQVVNDAIEYAKLESGTLDLERIGFDLRVAVGETATILEAEAREKGLEFSCQVHHQVPSLFWGDPGRLRQILLHLGRNAIRLSTGARVAIEIVRLREDDHDVTVRFGVSGARGVGDAANAPDTADPARADSADPGFDVLVVRRLIELMGGSVGTDPLGFRFDLTLERQAPHEEEDGGQLSRADLVGQRALVVFSSAVMRRTLMSRLESLDCEVAGAEGAEDALALLREGARSGAPFRWALIDRELANTNGEQLGAAIRADHALDGTLTLLLTSVGRRGDAARARERGFSAYLATTIEIDELAEALCEVLHRSATASTAGAAPLVTRYSLVEARRGRTRILVVEDSTVNQLVTQWALHRLGYRVEIVGAAAAARSAWQASSFDVAILDARLP
ncbi:MAG TPA: PAS domain S-box protein, partial [Terriglobales bacterium]|nr:PAS domain S-box protein [Terriglobales bacterium]